MGSRRRRTDGAGRGPPSCPACALEAHAATRLSIVSLLMGWSFCARIVASPVSTLTLPSPGSSMPSCGSLPLASMVPTRTIVSPASIGFQMKPSRMAPDLMNFAPWPGENGPTTATVFALPLLLDGAGGADRPLRAEGEDALEVRVGAHLVERGLVAVVHALRDAEAVGDELHLRDTSTSERDRRIGPLVVQRHGERADIDDVLAFAAHRLGERLHVRLAEAVTGRQLDVPVVVLLVRALVRQDLDARPPGRA